MVQPAVKDLDVFYEYLVDENGSPNLNVLGTKADPVEFKFVTPRVVELHRINFAVDSSTGKEDIIGFFSLGELTNGLTIVHRRRPAQGGTTHHNFGTGKVPIRRHNDFTSLAGVDVDSDSVGNTSRYSVRWTLVRSGMPHFMQQFEEFVVSVRDDLRGLDSFRVMVQGF